MSQGCVPMVTAQRGAIVLVTRFALFPYSISVRTGGNLRCVILLAVAAL